PHLHVHLKPLEATAGASGLGRSIPRQQWPLRSLVGSRLRGVCFRHVAAPAASRIWLTTVSIGRVASMMVAPNRRYRASAVWFHPITACISSGRLPNELVVLVA